MVKPMQGHFHRFLASAVVLTGVLVWVTSSSVWAQQTINLDVEIRDPRGLAWDGSSESFWINGGDALVLFELDGDTGAILRRVSLPSPQFQYPRNLAWQPSDESGETFWLADEGTRMLSKVWVGPNDGDVEIVHSFDAPDADLGEIVVTGLEWDSGSHPGVWMCTSLGLCTTIRKIDAESGDVLVSFYPVCDPRGLAILDNTLWTVSKGDALMPSRLMVFDITEDEWTRIKRSRRLEWVVVADRPVGLTTRDGDLWLIDREARTLFPMNMKN